MRQERAAWTTWIWVAGAVAWAVDGVFSLRWPNKQHAQLAFTMAALFAAAWLFYRQQKR